MRSTPAPTFILLCTLFLGFCSSVHAQTLHSIDSRGTDPAADGGVGSLPSVSATHSVTIHSDSESFALSGGAKRVPMSALAPWCNVPPERADEIIILTDPEVKSGISVNFVGVDAKMYGGLLGGFDQAATLRSGANAYEMTFRFTQPACDFDLATIKPFDDYITNTLTLEHKAGMRFAIFNVTSNTADPQVQTVPRKVSTVSTSSTPTSSATDVQQASSSGTGTNSTSAPVKNKGVPLEVIIAPVVIIGMCIIAGLVVLYVCVFRPRKLRSQKLYGPIDWDTPNRGVPPMRERERERDPTRVPLPPSLVGSNYSGASRPASSAGSTDALIRPYRVVPDSYTPDPPPKAALIDLANKRPVRPLYLNTSGASGSGSRHHDLHTNTQKASIAAWKAGHPPPVRPVDRVDLTRSLSFASETPSTSTAAVRDPRTLAALERAVRGAGFSTQALLESLNRVREGRARGMDSEIESVGADELPRYRVR